MAPDLLAVLAWALALLLVAPVFAANPPAESDFSQDDIESGNALAQLSAAASAEASTLARRSLRNLRRNGCSLSNIKIRREWRTLSKSKRRQYIDAVKCLQSTPSLYPELPGSKSLFDDFVSIHVMQTLNIHLSGTFLTWHRYFTYLYEEKLSQCGYDGGQPYWEWGLDVLDPAASPVFDGSDTSLGGDGDYFPHEGIPLGVPFETYFIDLPPGTGGGCVTTGPFANMEVNIGPVALPQYGTTNVTAVADPFDGTHTRCLKRDLNPGIAQRWTTFRNTTSLILQSNDVETFQAIMQADPRYTVGELGVHGGGHFVIAGDPGADPFISPGDPAFYLHHSQVDRVYWIWQLLDFPNRQDVFGTHTFLDFPPSDNVTVEDIMDFSPIGGQVKIKDIMNTVGGTPLCYIYL